MSASTSRRWLAPLAIGSVALPLLAYVWAARDSAPDFGSVAPIISMTVRPRLAGFAKLTSFAERVRQAKLEASHRLPARYEDDPRAVDEVLDSDFARGLPGAIEEVIASTSAGPAEAGVTPQAAQVTWPMTYASTRLLSLQMQRQWARKDDGAWETGQLQLRFVRFLLSQARSFGELTSAESSCAVVLRTFLAGIDARRLTRSQLDELEDLAEPADLVVQDLLEAIRSEYAIFEAQLDQVGAQKNSLLSRIFFQPNRTRRAWLAAMVVAAQALRLGDLARAYGTLGSAAMKLSGGRPLVRNSLGSHLTAMSLQGNIEALAQAVDLVAEFRLLKVRATVAIYRGNHGSVPVDLVGLRVPGVPATTNDPWATPDAAFRFSRSEGRIYSIGRDGRDDHGLFSNDFSYGGSASDLGLRFSKD